MDCKSKNKYNLNNCPTVTLVAPLYQVLSLPVLLLVIRVDIPQSTRKGDRTCDPPIRDEGQRPILAVTITQSGSAQGVFRYFD